VKKIKVEIKRRLGIWVPTTTIYHWITEGRKPNITPLKIHPELGYVVGTLMSDCMKSTYVVLEVRDRDYAESFTHALSTVTGREYKVREKGGYYIVKTEGATLRYIARNKLWKVVAYAYPKQFLQGLFDGDGGVGVGVRVSSRPGFIVQLTLINSDLKLLEFVKKLLKGLGIESTISLQRKCGTKTTICGRECTINRDCWRLIICRQESIIKFYKYIGFRIQRKQEVLRDAIEVLQRYRSNRDRVRAWKKIYVKRNGRWVKK